MYTFIAQNKRSEKQFYHYLHLRKGIAQKLKQLQQHPRTALHAHKLKGKLKGSWSCSLGDDIRMIYEIDDVKKEIIVMTVGSHKAYR